MKEEISVLITGDFYGGNRIDSLIKDELYGEIFNDFLPLVKESDISITNLESALTTESQTIKKTGPALKSSPKTIFALKYAGFNLLTLANNHILDYGEKGLVDTMNLCIANNIDFLGVGMNINEASSVKYKQIKGKNLAFVNVAENEWSTTHGDVPGANPLDAISNYYSIQEARKNADFVFVIVHGGHEMYNLPSPRMKQTYRFFVHAGANAVIGHHTHCYSGYEIYQGCPIFYSLGNFIFDNKNYRNSIWNSGFAARFLIEGNKLSYTLFPYIQNSTSIGVQLMGKEEISEFAKNINKLNSTIQNDNELHDRFKHFCSKVKRTYKAFLEPHSNKYLFALQNRNIFPSLLRENKRLLLLNISRCEAHRDVLNEILTQ
jgi:poly-gamma-glutamate synthesis protein (capsule biosynthesis protein)